MHALQDALSATITAANPFDDDFGGVGFAASAPASRAGTVGDFGGLGGSAANPYASTESEPLHVSAGISADPFGFQVDTGAATTRTTDMAYKPTVAPLSAHAEVKQKKKTRHVVVVVSLNAVIFFRATLSTTSLETSTRARKPVNRPSSNVLHLRGPFHFIHLQVPCRRIGRRPPNRTIPSSRQRTTPLRRRSRP